VFAGVATWQEVCMSEGTAMQIQHFTPCLPLAVDNVRIWHDVPEAGTSLYLHAAILFTSY
jgi:hypothetical protein